MTYKEFSEIFKKERITRNITQKEMAFMIPLEVTSYNRIENGKKEPSFVVLQRICQILEIDLTTLLELKKPNHEHKAYYD